jgi:hypothetical protein
MGQAVQIDTSAFSREHADLALLRKRGRLALNLERSDPHPSAEIR